MARIKIDHTVDRYCVSCKARKLLSLYNCNNKFIKQEKSKTRMYDSLFRQYILDNTLSIIHLSYFMTNSVFTACEFHAEFCFHNLSLLYCKVNIFVLQGCICVCVSYTTCIFCVAWIVYKKPIFC